MLTLLFEKELRPLLPAQYRSTGLIIHSLERRASIKDIIESFGPPHPEIGEILVNGLAADFSYIPAGDESVRISGLRIPQDPCKPHLLRPNPPSKIAFLADCTVNKLGRLLRMTGFDTLVAPPGPEEDVCQQAVRAYRVLLSRNRSLLKRKEVVFGHLVRSEFPPEQLTEIITLYGLEDRLRPFSRCLECNSLLEDVKKSEILSSLQPLTRIHYHLFKQCPGCRKIYWKGSHLDNMKRHLPGAAGSSTP